MPRRPFQLLLLLALPWGGLCCNRNPPSDQTLRDVATERANSDAAQIDAPGLHNVYRITDKLYSGSSPEGREGFRSLKELGIKTVISVDGARPDVVTAHTFGLRYVHIPFGYDGISRPQVLRLAKAVRDLPGPVYVHCHHGKHRGPTAAAAIHLCLDEKCTVQQAIAEMSRAGTDAHYTGLYAVPKTLNRPTAEDLDRVPADFPEIARVADLAQFMVEIDARWENLKLIRAAGWKTPPDHADLDPPHEALQLVEQVREAGRLEQVKACPDEFRRSLADAEGKASRLEELLRLGRAERQVDPAEAERAFQKIGAACTHCHAKYRDVPKNSARGAP